MKKPLIKLLSLFVTLVLVFGLASPAFAMTAAESPEEPNYEFYTAMGTSITAGYGLPNARYGANDVFTNDYTYARLLADQFGIAGHYSGALLGTRAMEYRMLLEDDYNEADDYNEFWVEKNCQNGLEHLKQKAPAYKENLAKSDLVSFEIGLNDVTSYAMCSMMTWLQEEAKGTEYEGDIIGMITAMLTKGIESGEGPDAGDNTQDLLTLVALGTLFENFSDLMSRMVTYFMEGMEAFSENFPLVMRDIRDINPTADLFVVGCYNPIGYLLRNEVTANENGNVDIRNLILGAGEYVGLTNEQITYIVELMQEFVIDAQNTVMQSYERKYDYTFVDTRGILLNDSVDGTHPGVPGHAYIAEHIADAIYELYPCQHHNATTYNTIIPTILTLGYTGSVRCNDCGKVLQYGQLITYSQYQKLKDAGTVPGGEYDPEEDIDPFIFPPAGEPKEHEGYDVLAFTSDVHNKTGNVAATRFANWIDDVQVEIGKVDFFGACGDYAEGNGSANNDAYWNLAKSFIDIVKGSAIENWVLTTGNHEQENGKYNTTSNSVADDIQMIGEAEVPADANYKVYCFGATQSEQKFLDEEIAALDNYLSGVPADCPVFVLSHFPLHDQGNRTIQNKEAVIEVLNKYPNVIFVWGHNHTEANSTEVHYGRVYTDTIEGVEINFTYAPAGCMSDSENNAGSAAVTGKGLIVTVDDDDVIGDGIYPEVTMQYVDAGAAASSQVYNIDLTDDGEREAEATALETGYAYEKVDSLTEDGEYIIAYKDGDVYKALNLAICDGYTNTNSYRYSGYKGAAVTVEGDAVVGGVDSDMVWKLENSTGKWTIKNVLTGKYLNASYAKNGIKDNSNDGKIFLANTMDTWTLSGSQLKSAAAGKTLAFDKTGDIDKPYAGTQDFFTVRSTGDDMVFFKVTGNPVAEGTPSQDEPTTPSTPTTGIDTDKTYVISYANRALAISTNSGYVEGNNTFSGLNAKTISFDESGAIVPESLTRDALWKFEKASGSEYRIKNVYSGQYLGSTYTSTGGGWWWNPTPKTDKGDLFMTADTGYTWTVNGKNLVNKQTGKALAFETPETVAEGYEGSVYFFTVHTDGSRIKLSAVDAAVADPTDEQMLGKCSEWKQANIGDGNFCIVLNGYAIGVDAASGFITKKISDPSELDSLGSSYQWKISNTAKGYTFENVGRSGRFIGAYTESSIFTTKSSARVLSAAYPWNFNDNHITVTTSPRGILNIAIPVTNYLTCDNGTVSLSTKNMSDTVKLYAMAKSDNQHNVEVTTVQPTCTEEGLTTIRCTVCGATVTKTIPAAGHFDEDADGRCDICGLELQSGDPVAEPTTYVVTVDGVKHNYKVGEPVSLSAGSRAGYTFRSWTVKGADLGIDLTQADIAFEMVDADLTITSNWDAIPKYTLSFNSNGGTSYDSVKAVSGTVVDLTKYKPTKSGYNFDGWYLDKSLKNAAGDSVTLTDDMTVYAHWTEKSSGLLNTIFTGIRNLFR